MLRSHLAALVAGGVMQSVNTLIDGVAVDVHFDVLKFGLPPRQRDLAWQRTQPFVLRDGSRIRVPDAELSLVHFLVHLNMDSFAWLLGFADMARVLRPPIDWGFVERFVRSEGLEVVAYRSLTTVFAPGLSLPLPPLPRVHGPRAWAWDAAWPTRATLLGSAGAHRSRRQDVLPFLVRSRGGEALLWVARAVAPPRSTVEHRYPTERGPYVVRLARGRLRTVLSRRAALRSRRRPVARRYPAATAPLLREAVQTRPLWIDVHGGSMGRSIPDGARVRVEAADRPRRGEVWAFADGDGHLVVHRYRGETPDGFRFQGDIRVRADAMVSAEQLVGRVVDVGPGRAAWRWGRVAGAVQRTPRAVVAALVRRWR